MPEAETQCTHADAADIGSGAADSLRQRRECARQGTLRNTGRGNILSRLSCLFRGHQPPEHLSACEYGQKAGQKEGEKHGSESTATRANGVCEVRAAKPDAGTVAAVAESAAQGAGRAGREARLILPLYRAVASGLPFTRRCADKLPATATCRAVTLDTTKKLARTPRHDSANPPPSLQQKKLACFIH
jgi:hypothetical protein